MLRLYPIGRGPWFIFPWPEIDSRCCVIRTQNDLIGMIAHRGLGPTGVFVDMCDLIRSAKISLTRLDVEALEIDTDGEERAPE